MGLNKGQLDTALQKHTQRTLVLIKPEAVRRGLATTILARFERAGLKIIALRMVQASRSLAEKQYTYEDIAARHGEEIRDHLLSYITEGPVIAAAIEGIAGIGVVRKLCGATESASAAPGTIRGDYSHHSYGFCNEAHIAVRNIVHASASPEEAHRELELWFRDADFVTYTRSDELK